MKAQAKKALMGDLLIERELLTIVASLKLKLERREAVYSLLQMEDEAPFSEVVQYFFKGDHLKSEARQVWQMLLRYRSDMSETYGDRVSLHIAVYHMTRDPQFLQEQSFASVLESSPLVQLLAVQELKAWWERCSETGAHLREVMDQQLERLVYFGLKNNAPVSLVLVSIHQAKAEQSVGAEQRSEFARFLMDCCRCRDIIGHYEDDTFALIFPQTPRQGARIAVDRLRKFFHDHFGRGLYHFDAVMSNCPENGKRGRDIALKASETLAQMRRQGQHNEIVECEGELQGLYLWWIFVLKQPLLDVLRSPQKMIAALLMVGLTVWGVNTMQFNSIQKWELVAKQTLDESGTLPRWQWGRGQGEAFELVQEDGFVAHSGEIICESGDLWFQVPVALKGDVKISFSFKGSLDASFSLRLADQAQDEFAVLIIEPGWVKTMSEGVVMEALPVTLDVTTSHRFEMALDERGLTLTLDNLPLLEDGRWSLVDAWPSSLYMNSSRGTVLLWDLEVHDRGQSPGLPGDDWADKLMAHSSLDPRPWAELLLKAPARLETVLRANLKKRLFHPLGDNSLEQRRSLMETYGEGVLGGSRLWRHWLQERSVYALVDDWGTEMVQRSPVLGPLLKASLAEDPVGVMKAHVDAELWGQEKADFLECVLALDWGEQRKAMSQWVWVELIGLFEELPSEEVLLICSRFLEASLIPDDPFFVTRVCEKLLELGPYAPLKVYRSIAGNPMAMKAIEAWPRDHEKPLLTLLQAKAKATFSERHDLLQALDQWVHKTDFGKIMRLDWMWLHLQDGSLEGRESRVFIERLRLQSRRLEMAREAQLLKAKNF